MFCGVHVEVNSLSTLWIPGVVIKRKCNGGEKDPMQQSSPEGFLLGKREHKKGEGEGEGAPEKKREAERRGETERPQRSREG